MIRLALVLLLAAPIVAQEKPNIVLFLADDLGWKDVGYHGSEIRTPVLDKLAAEGVRLEQFYVQSLCTPTRAALMTGRYPYRYGLRTITPWIQYGLPVEERTLAEALREAGYVTAIVGKWHLGHNDPKYLPTRRGFDHQYGCYCGAIDYFTHKRGEGLDWHRNDKALEEEGYATTLIAKEATRLIGEHDVERPLFLYVPFTTPHMPLQAPQKYIEEYMTIRGETRRKYAAMVDCMDDAIGEVVAALDEKGMRENTLIIFSSDNGGAQNCGSNNTPFRGFKKSDYEGAVRVPAFFSWPKRLKPAVVNEMLHITDLFPTLVTLAGGSLKQELALDGRDAWATLAEGAPTPHEEILINISPERAALRRGKWKLVKTRTEVELFDLEADPSELENLARKNKTKRAELLERIAFYKQDEVPPPGGGSQARPADFVAPKVWGEN